MSGISFKLFALVAGHLFDSADCARQVACRSVEPVQEQPLGNEEFPQINEKTTWERSLACNQLDYLPKGHTYVES